MKFVPLPKGMFFMGWNLRKKGMKTEIKEDFEIAIYTVTQEHWEKVMSNNPTFSRAMAGEGQGHAAATCHCVTVHGCADSIRRPLFHNPRLPMREGDVRCLPIHQVCWSSGHQKADEQRAAARRCRQKELFSQRQPPGFRFHKR